MELNSSGDKAFGRAATVHVVSINVPSPGQLSGVAGPSGVGAPSPSKAGKESGPLV